MKVFRVLCRRYFHWIALVVAFAAGTVPDVSEAYPDFVSYGYRSCMTCHYNAAGGGPLSDYGRALWAAEIAGKPFWTRKTDEQLGQSSGFVGNVESLPYWLRPYAKYRGLYYLTSPGEPDSVARWIQMQADAGLTISLDPDGKWILSGGDRLCSDSEGGLAAAAG
ncbi:MAG: hypothetical protein HC902_06755 [Calothrix sp. SM1_5_4]|nr:hypothetical protein [Calothrix sp. SM1_5_4]